MSTEFTHCGHGKRYTEDCAKCEDVWYQTVTLPMYRKLKREVEQHDQRAKESK